MNEFEAIEKYFAPLSRDGLRDDAAVLAVPPGHDLVVTSDTLSEGVHFLKSMSPAEIAHRALRVNLSDLAAMGARALCYQLNIAFPDKPETFWLESFTAALQADQEQFGLFCSGGDTTIIKGPLTISITALGLVPTGRAITRSGAQAGDHLILTGPVGEGYLALKIPGDPHFMRRYTKPQPRLDLRKPLQAYARAAIDISDGLVADLEHLCRASNLGAQIQISAALFSLQAQKIIQSGQVAPEELLGGGDDYELLLAVPPDHLAAFMHAAPGCIEIGTFKAGPLAVDLRDEKGCPLVLKHTGWSHF